MHDQMHDAQASHDVLDHIRPTVVVRRRIWEPPDDLRPASRGIRRGEAEPSREARAPAQVPEARVAPVPVVVPAPTSAGAPTRAPTRTLHVDTTTTLAELARRMGVASSELAAELVARGWFEVTARATLSRGAWRAAAAAFGWDVAPGPGDEDAAPRGTPPRSAPRARRKACCKSGRAATPKKRAA